MIVKLILFSILSANVACASQYPRVDQDISNYDQQVKNMKSTFLSEPSSPQNKVGVQSKIDNMVQVD